MNTPDLRDYLNVPGEQDKLPLLYTFTDYYNQIAKPYHEVENINMVHSAFHQTGRHIAGFFYKHITNIDFDGNKTIPLETN
jgi:hypothetical protein